MTAKVVDIPKEYRDAMRKIDVIRGLIAQRKYALASEVIEELIEAHPDSSIRFVGLSLRARDRERGGAYHRDLDGALDDYRILQQASGFLRTKGLVGEARVLCTKDFRNSIKRITELCETAISESADVRAMMLLGLTIEYGHGDFSSAAHWYRQAFKHGSVWGGRRYAKILAAQGKRIRAILFHVRTSLVALYLALRHGLSEPIS